MTTIFEENKKKWGLLLPSELNPWNCGSPRRYMTKPIRARKVPMAHHDTISHIIGGPCIHIVSRFARYSLPSILEHEMIHCALMRIGEETGNIGEKDLDNLIHVVADHNRLLRVNKGKQS